jgi:hypothetical protein
MVWIGVGFLLGRKFGYRLALEVQMVVTDRDPDLRSSALVLAWAHQACRVSHIGFGVLIPEAEPPGKMLTAIAFFLDAIGPLAIWHIAVSIIGASALSGAPRKTVAWVIGGLYLALMLLFAAIVLVVPTGM